MKFILFTIFLFISISTCDLVLKSSKTTFGPFTVQPHKMFYQETLQPIVPELSAATKIGIKTISYRLYDDSGAERGPDYVYLHHLIGILQEVPSVACPNNWPFFGAGAELVDMVLPDGYIFGLDAGQMIEYELDLMNHDHHDPRNITIVQTIEYYILTGKENFKNTEIYLISVNGCNAGTEFEVPQGKPGDKFIRYVEFPSNVQGKFAWLQGHVHMGGLDIYLMNTETSEVYFNSLPTYDSNGYLIDMYGANPMNTVPMNAPLRLVAIYDQAEALEDAMGIMIGFIEVEKWTKSTPSEKVGNGNPVQAPSHAFGPLVMIIVGIFIGVVLVLLVIGAVVGFRIYRQKKAQKYGSGNSKYTLGPDDDNL